jgi:hypothetical protein
MMEQTWVAEEVGFLEAHLAQQEAIPLRPHPGSLGRVLPLQTPRETGIKGAGLGRQACIQMLMEEAPFQGQEEAAPEDVSRRAERWNLAALAGSAAPIRLVVAQQAVRRPAQPEPQVQQILLENAGMEEAVEEVVAPVAPPRAGLAESAEHREAAAVVVGRR